MHAARHKKMNKSGVSHKHSIKINHYFSRALPFQVTDVAMKTDGFEKFFQKDRL